MSAEKPDVVSLFVPYTAAADSVIECIEAEIPLVVTYAEGIPQYDQLRVSRVKPGVCSLTMLMQTYRYKRPCVVSRKPESWEPTVRA